jgi:exodeoxyribonuclease VII small subunit
MESKKFEDAMKELNMIVKALESDDISLEDAIEKFKVGMTLAKECHLKLSEIEKSVHQIINSEGQLEANKLGE